MKIKSNRSYSLNKEIIIQRFFSTLEILNFIIK